MRRPYINPSILVTLVAFEKNEISIKELKEKLKLTRKQAWVRLKQLEKSGFVERTRRKGVWRLTRKGIERVELYRKYYNMSVLNMEIVDAIIKNMKDETDPSRLYNKTRVGVEIVVNQIQFIILYLLFLELKMVNELFLDEKEREGIIRNINSDVKKYIDKLIEELRGISLRAFKEYDARIWLDLMDMMGAAYCNFNRLLKIYNSLLDAYQEKLP